MCNTAYFEQIVHHQRGQLWYAYLYNVIQGTTTVHPTCTENTRVMFKTITKGHVSLHWFHCFQTRSRLIPLFSDAKPTVFCIAYFAKIELESDKKNTRAVLLNIRKFFDFGGLERQQRGGFGKKTIIKRLRGYSDSIFTLAFIEPPPHWIHSHAHASVELPTHSRTTTSKFKRTTKGHVSLCWFHCFQRRSRQCFCKAYFAKIELKSDKKNTRAMLISSFPIILQSLG